MSGDCSEMRIMKKRILAIGLDSAPPELLFDKFIDKLPNLSKLVKNGMRGKLESSHPPITVPAWAVMYTSKTPGDLGMYGFRHRKRGSYTEYYIVSSQSVKEPMLWDIIGSHGLKSCVIGIPPSYPPKPLNGQLISCFITPDADKEYTYPRELKIEVEKLVGRYIFDVVFRTEKRRKLLKELFQMTDKHFRVLNYLIERYKWDFFGFVEIGVDRVHHAYWKYFDENHHLYTPGSEFSDVIERYYITIDEKIGELLKHIDDNTIVFILSDHGAKGMRGAFCINEWLADRGYLTFKSRPKEPIDLEKASIDWSQTKAWGWGGYYARIFINLKGREPRGIISPDRYEEIIDELKEDLNSIEDPNGRKMNNKIYRPKDLYPIVKGDPPDMMVYFDDLYWRSAGTVGHNTIYLPENDKGPDDAVHSMYGIFSIYDPSETISSKDLGIVSIYDVMPTMLKIMKIPIPKNLRGKPLRWLDG